MIYNSKGYEVILLDSVGDVLTYLQMAEEAATDVFTTLIEGDLDIERWTHYTERTNKYIRGTAQSSIVLGSLKETNPIYEIAGLLASKTQNMLKFIEDGKVVIVNRNGGYSYITSDYHTILNSEEINAGSLAKSKISLKKDSKLLVLENSPELPEAVEAKAIEMDPNFSSVCGLSKMSKEGIIDMLKSFTDGGGDSIYVQTTGYDIEQIKQVAGIVNFFVRNIKEVTVEVTGGPTPELEVIANTLRDKGVSIIIEEQKIQLKSLKSKNKQVSR